MQDYIKYGSTFGVSLRRAARCLLTFAGRGRGFLNYIIDNACIKSLLRRALVIHHVYEAEAR